MRTTWTRCHPCSVVTSLPPIPVLVFIAPLEIPSPSLSCPFVLFCGLGRPSSTLADLNRNGAGLQIRKHFNERYSLVTPSPSYPFLGVSTTGVALFWGCSLGLILGLVVAPSAVTRMGMGDGVAAGGMGVVTVLGCMVAVYVAVDMMGMGGPRKRDTPAEEWEHGR